MTTTAQTETIYGTARARFFLHHGVETRRVGVDPDGTVRVFDATCGYYTIMHSLAPSAVRRIARKLRAEAME